MTRKYLSTRILSLLLALALLLTPAAAWARETSAPPLTAALAEAATEADPTDAEAAEGADAEAAEQQTSSGGQSIMSDLDWARYYVRNHSFYELDLEIIRAAQTPEDLLKELQALDVWAQYYDADQFAALNEYHDGDEMSVGLGVFLGLDENGDVIIYGTIAGSAAEKARLRYGDKIVSVDGVDTRNATLSELQSHLSGENGDFLVIRYERDGVVYEDTFSINARTELSIAYWLLDGTDGVAYLHIERFTSHTPAQVEAALKSLENQGMTALVLDLRDCPGGLVESALETSGIFAGTGPMVFFVSRFGWQNFGAVNYNTYEFELPLAVLINENTASSAEILAANIQDVKAGPLVGVTSYGKGVVQSLQPLPSGAGLVLTTAKFISHGYQDITANGGLLPDIYVTGADAQMRAALASIEAQRLDTRYLKFYIGINGYSQNGDWQNGPAALMRDGSSYLPAFLTLEQLGWQIEERDGLYYGERGTRRFVLNPAELQLLTGFAPYPLLQESDVLYLPAAALQTLGHEVEWDGGERSVLVKR